MHFFLRLLIRTMHFKNASIVTVALGFILISATLAFAIEPDTFRNWFNALYWVLTTMSTVGYGDYYAKTASGKLLTIFLYIFGIGLLSILIGKVIDSVASIQRQREAGQLTYPGKDHFIVVNWSKKAQYAVDEILAALPDAEIVLVDESDRHPQQHRRNVHFVSGDPSALQPTAYPRARGRDLRGSRRTYVAHLRRRLSSVAVPRRDAHFRPGGPGREPEAGSADSAGSKALYFGGRSHFSGP
ncbi:potassium channel family protein [Cohnella sp. GCM10020058]|uniref:potassium channel family protein n=1 Tax=Cohnella sp. GCM10020058 TaxID=3317330 RepID=UPI00363CAFF1